MSEEEEQYNKAALELVDWVEQNANLGPIVGVVLMDICTRLLVQVRWVG